MEHHEPGAEQQLQSHERQAPAMACHFRLCGGLSHLGSTYLGIRIAIETLPPFLMAGSRYLLAGLVLYLILWWRGEPSPRPAHWRDAAVVGALLLLLQMPC